MNDVRLVLVDQIDPHPSNPRRELGDLTELADSIKAHGIRQNLLLVPNPDIAGRWRTVIGHRRIAAAKAAGVVEVPAVIDRGLSEVDQLELMLLENVQRADLSPIEEAEGYQGLLDLGVKVTMIARRTGRAAGTVKRRLQLLGMPDGARDKVHRRQASLEDAAALVELGDHPEAEWLAEQLGTSNFPWQVERIRNDIERTAKLRKLADKLVGKGVTELEEDSSELGTYRLLEHLGPNDKADDLPDGAVLTCSSHYVRIYKPKSQEELDRADKSAAAKERRDRRAAEQAEAKAKLDAERETVWDLRDAFVRNLLQRKPTAAQRQAIVDALVPLAITVSSGSWELAAWLGHDGLFGVRLIEQCMDVPAEWLLLAWTHVHVGEMKHTYPKAMSHPYAIALYGVLEQLGYTLSDVERARLYPTGEDDAEVES